MARVDEIADNIFRINVSVPGRPVTFSLFVIRDEQPMLVETGMSRHFPEIQEAVARVIDPATIRYILVPHFEADECGAMNQFLQVAPHAEVLGSPIGARGSLADFAIRPPRAVEDDQVLDLGNHRVRVLITPYIHQWDSLLAHDDSSGTLFSSDLFMQRGEGPAITEEDLTESMVAYLRESGIMPSMAHLHAALDRIEPLNPLRIACHHGSTIAGAVVPRYFQAIRDNDVTAFAASGGSTVTY